MSAPAGRLPLVVLASGRGSNLQAIVRDIEAGRLDADVRAVLSDKPEAPVLAWSRTRGIAAEALPAAGFADRALYDAALAERVAAFEPGLVVLAGFMRILSPAFVDAFEGRMVNIHPSLLPRHRGLHTHRRVLEAGEREHGASVHFVTRELDGGPVVLQARVPVRDHDDEVSLAARVLEQEHRIYPAAIGWFAAGRLCYRNGAAWLDGRRLDHPVVIEATDEIAA